MKWTFLLSLVAAFASATDVSAQSKVITIDWYELDCSKCEKLAHEVFASDNEARVFQSDEAALTQLKDVATTRGILKHTQQLNTEGWSKHQTEIDEIQFNFDVNVVEVDSGSYKVDLRAKLSKPAKKKRSGGIGQIFAASQSQGRESISLVNRIVVAEGQSMAIASSSVSVDSGATIVRVFVVGIQECAEQ